MGGAIVIFVAACLSYWFIKQLFPILYQFVKEKFSAAVTFTVVIWIIYLIIHLR